MPGTGDRGRGTERAAAFGILALLTLPIPLQAQAAFYAPDSAMVFTIRTDIRALKRDRVIDDAPWHGGTLTWNGPDGERSVPVRLRTRGVFRLNYCDMPPVRLRFSEDSVRGTPFDGLRRPRLASFCMDRDEYEQNALHEYTLYRVQRLFSPLSYAARVVRVTWMDSTGNARPVTRYAFLLEDDDRFARRLHAEPITIQGVRQGDLERGSAALLGVWQYFIGNTDWSVPGLHNVDLYRVQDTVKAVAYDFDWAGAIDARYAKPDPRLGTRSVRARVYRGLCLTAEELEPVLAQFEALRDSVAAVYRRTPALDPRTVERTLSWYGEFYREIADRRRFARDVVRSTCMQ